MEDYGLVVFSHLRWDFVFQRPQHLFSRLASHHRVCFIEEPIFDAAATEPFWERANPACNVTVFRAHTAVAAPGFNDAQLLVIRPLVAELPEKEQLSDYVVWFYTPMAVPLLQELSPQAVVYDCMDELSLFLGAPPELLPREAELLHRADVVFTGGPSLYRAKQGKHANVHCFPSSVDASHFRHAHTCRDAADQQALPHPRFGFYGVIDERMDLPLIDALAHARPDWQIVMVGPVVKIAPESLPRHSNLHYLGSRQYADLPSYLAGWDVCLLPFAQNSSTRFISPTKTLEYMAAEKMIVSTPITDVAEPYGNLVYLGDSPDAFITACEQALQVPKPERVARVEGMRRLLSQTSWEQTTQAMDTLIGEAIARNRRSRSFSTAILNTAAQYPLSPS